MSKNKGVKRSIRNEQDTAWKEIIDCYFKDFIHYCLPELAEQIDWTKPVVSLDKELQALTKGAKTGKRLLDKLFKVFLKADPEKELLIHIEVQDRKEVIFPERMFTYGYRIWDGYQIPILSCAILTDPNKDWKPSEYKVGVGSSLGIDFINIKLLEYKNRKEELELSTNPFATVILIQLAAIECKFKSAAERKQVKFLLTKRLYDKGFAKQDIANLYRFIDWLIGLPEAYEVDYLNDVHQLEEALQMPYITSAERIGQQRGLKVGREQGLVEGRVEGRVEGQLEGEMNLIKRMLMKGLDPDFISKNTEISLHKIEEILKELQNQTSLSPMEDQIN